MSNTKTFSCPTCNAPLTTTGNETEVQCRFCGNTVIVPAELRNQPVIPAVPMAINVGVQPIPTVPSTGNGGCVVAAVIFAVIAAAIVGIVVMVAVPVTSQVDSVVSTAVTILPTATEAVTVVSTFGGEGTGAGRFTEPNEFAVDGKGFVYVSDRTTGVIQRFDPDGHYLSQWQANPKAEYGPNCLAADHVGNVYACGGSQNGLLKFDGATGKLLATLPNGKSQDSFFRSSMAALLDGTLLAYETNSDQILSLDATGKVLHRTDKISSHLDARNTTFNVQIAVDGLGNSFALETISEYIMVFKPDGTFVNRFGGKGDGPDQFFNALSIAVDARSRVFTIDLDSIKVFDHTGHFVTSYPLPATANRVSALSMAFDDAGYLYVLGTDKKIYKMKFPATSES